MKLINNRVFNLNFDYLINEIGFFNLDDCTKSYIKSINYYFLGNLGYSKRHNFVELDNYKINYNLDYDEIHLTYLGINYKIKFSSFSGKHGKVLNFPYYCLSYNRPINEYLNDFLFFIPEYETIYNKEFDIIQILDRGLSFEEIQSNHNMIIYKEYLNSSFNLSHFDCLKMFFNYYFISLEEYGKSSGKFVDEISSIYENLKCKGYNLEIKLNPSNNSQNSCMSIKILDNEGIISVNGSNYFMELLYSNFWDILLDFHLVYSTHYNKNRDINLRKIFY